MDGQATINNFRLLIS